MKNKSTLLLPIAFLLALGACKTQHPVTPHRPGADLTVSGKVERYNARVKTFSGRADLSLNSATMGSKITVKAIVDSALVISLQPFLGIELGRVYCDRSRVLLIDKYHNQYASHAYTDTPSLPLSLDWIQGLLLGRYFDPFGVGFGQYRAGVDGNDRQIGYEREGAEAEFMSDEQGRLIRSYARAADGKTYGLAEYSQFSTANGFPLRMDVKLASPKMIEAMTVQYGKADLNGEVSVERPSVDKYRKVSVEKFMSDLTKF